MLGQERAGDLSDYKLKKLWEQNEPEKSPTLFEAWKSSRRKAQVDLFWLCGLLGYAVTEKAHRDICQNFFVQKNPDIPLSDLLIEKPDRLLFAPRGGYKSSIRNADAVQWILSYVDCKIAIQSSKDDLSSAMVEEVKNFFLAPEAADANLTLTRFQVLFPDHTLPERSHGPVGSFTSPARKTFSKEPSALALSIEESKSSTHFDIGYSDDCCSEVNSGIGASEDARQIVAKKLLESRNLFDLCRYFVGTPQDGSDGYTLLKENLGDDLFVMVKSAWEVKPPSASKAEAELTEQDFALWFPFDAKGKPKLTYRALKTLQRAGKESFATQQLCRSVLQKEKIEISSALIESHILPGAPDYFALNPSPIISAWDLSYITANSSPRADYSVGCAGLKDEIRGAIVQDIQRGQYLKHDLIRAMAAQAVQFRVNTIWIEGTPGSHFLYDDLIAALQLAGASTTKVEFIAVDNQLDAKATRFRSIYDALKSGELWFAIDPAQVQILYELTKARGKKRDDVDDSLAHLIAKLREPIDPCPREIPASPAQMLLVEKQLRDRVYGTTDSPKDRPEPEPPWGYRVEELKSEPLKEFEGQPVFRDSHEYLYGSQN
jgi:hypothetical protein